MTSYFATVLYISDFVSLSVEDLGLDFELPIDLVPDSVNVGDAIMITVKEAVQPKRRYSEEDSGGFVKNRKSPKLD